MFFIFFSTKPAAFYLLHRANYSGELGVVIHNCVIYEHLTGSRWQRCVISKISCEVSFLILFFFSSLFCCCCCVVRFSWFRSEEACMTLRTTDYYFHFILFFRCFFLRVLATKLGERNTRTPRKRKTRNYRKK